MGKSWLSWPWPPGLPGLPGLRVGVVAETILSSAYQYAQLEVREATTCNSRLNAG